VHPALIHEENYFLYIAQVSMYWGPRQAARGRRFQRLGWCSDPEIRTLDCFVSPPAMFCVCFRGDCAVRGGRRHPQKASSVVERRRPAPVEAGPGDAFGDGDDDEPTTDSWEAVVCSSSSCPERWSKYKRLTL
jgi:hypothetical protein